MKISTARRLVCMSYFTVDGLRPLLATATRIVCSGDTKRFLFPDGSVIESVKGNWKVVGMEKNPKLEAAVRRFGNGQKLPDRPFEEKVHDAVELGGISPNTARALLRGEEWPVDAKPFISETTARLQMEVIALQELCNEKDEQLDKASRPMVVRLDMWLVIIAICIAVSRFT